jgi:hypothetical protein
MPATNPPFSDQLTILASQQQQATTAAAGVSRQTSACSWDTIAALVMYRYPQSRDLWVGALRCTHPRPALAAAACKPQPSPFLTCTYLPYPLLLLLPAADL